MNIFYGFLSKVATSTVSNCTNITDFCKFVLYCIIVHYKTSAFGSTLDYQLCGKQHTFETALWKCFCIFQLKKKNTTDPFNQTKSLSLVCSQWILPSENKI